MTRRRNFKLKMRELYQKTLLPVGQFIGKTGISPNLITILSGLFAVATAVMYAFNGRVGSFDFWWLIGFGLMIFTGFLDVLDGSVARAMDKATKFGKVLDPVMDRFAEFCFLVGIAIGKYDFDPLESHWSPVTTIPVGAWCFFCFAGMIFASYARARGESVSSVSIESVGIMERREKLALLYLGNILYYWFHIALVIAIVLIGLLSFITTIQRIVYIRKVIANIENEARELASKTTNEDSPELTEMTELKEEAEIGESNRRLVAVEGE